MRKLWGMLAAGLVALGSVGAVQAQETRLSDIIERQKIVIGVTSESPPFGFINDKNELDGFEIDLAKLIGRALFGKDGHVELVQQSFSARWDNINSGRIDFGLQVTTVYPERLLRVAFTRPYIDTGTAVMVRSSDSYSSIEELNKPELRAGIVTNPQQEARRARYFPATQPVAFDGYSPLLLALRTNRVDFIQMELPQAQWYAASDERLVVLPGLISEPSYNAIFVKIGDTPLLAALDQIVASMRGGPLHSEYSEIFEKWFGVVPDRQSP